MEHAHAAHSAESAMAEAAEPQVLHRCHGGAIEAEKGKQNLVRNSTKSGDKLTKFSKFWHQISLNPVPFYL